MAVSAPVCTSVCASIADPPEPDLALYGRGTCAHCDFGRQSGFSFKGGRPRCFAFWQEFQKCYVQADTPSDCIGAKEDYLECLHHTKEIARAKEIKDTWIARQAKDAHAAREKGEVRATSSIMDLGLINDTKNDKNDAASSGSESS